MLAWRVRLVLKLRSPAIPCSTVCLGLQVEQLRVTTIQRHEVAMRAVFDDVPVLQYEDAIGQPHGAEAVADEHRGLPRREHAKVREDLVLRLRIE